MALAYLASLYAPNERRAQFGNFRWLKGTVQLASLGAHGIAAHQRIIRDVACLSSSSAVLKTASPRSFCFKVNIYPVDAVMARAWKCA